MKKFIGIDVHSATFTMVVMKEDGRVERSVRRKTTEKELIEAVSKVMDERHVILEESHMAQWTKMVLQAYSDRLVVCDPVFNRWIAQDDFADDLTSATKLADLLRMGRIKEVYHPEEDDMIELRRLFCHYVHINRYLTQSKNALKATFRQVAVLGEGRGIYQWDNRDKWMAKIKAYPSLQQQAAQFYQTIDSFEEYKKQTKESMTKIARRQPGFDLLRTFPGVGDIIACGYLAILVTPHRFSRRNKLWRYASLGNVRHISDDTDYKKGHSRTGNRALKWLLSQHFQAAVHRNVRGRNRFKEKYLSLVTSGMREAVARRHVCRNILSAILAAWKKGEAYRDEIIVTAE